MNVQKSEIYRYLGLGTQPPDKRTELAVEEGLTLLLQQIRPRFFYREYPLILAEEGIVDFSCFQVKSQALSKNLNGCERVILCSATLGMEMDLLLRRYSRVDTGKAVVLQAVGAALIEEFCDEENEKLKRAYEKRGFFLHPRFSPGYGDFPLTVQADFLESLGGEKSTGIMVTDSSLMLPSKSVTAVIGAERKKEGEKKRKLQKIKENKCSCCENNGCLYRRSDNQPQSAKNRGEGV